MKKLITLLTMITALSLIFTGCSATNTITDIPKSFRELFDGEIPDLESSQDLAIILQRDFQNMPDFDNSPFEEELEDVVKNGTVHFIVPDSNPESNYVSFTYEKIDENKPAEQIKNQIKNRVDNLKTFSYTLGAKNEECNLVKSLLLAKQLLDSSNSDRTKRIIVASNMLNTYTPLMFTTEMLDSVQTSTMDILNTQNNIPDLRGYIVEVYFTGQVISPQKELSETEKINLKNNWKYYFDLAHATVNFHEDLPQPRPEIYQNKEPLPAVSCIETTGDQDAVVLGKPIYINEQAVEFEADKDSFKDEKKAQKTLASFVDNINSFSGSILLLGTTAKPFGAKESSCKELSLRRAKRVKETLIELGVTNPDKLICAGGGFSTPFYKENNNKDGSFNESIARLNRNIILLSENNEDFSELLTKFGE